MDNLPQFLKALEEQENLIYEEIEKVIFETTNEVYRALLEDRTLGGTPRITGWLAGNWIISLDTPKSGTAGSKAAVGTAVAAQKSAFSNFKRSDLLSVNMIYINNNVPYGPIVNDKQGFVEDSVARGVRRLSKERVIK